jgi:hypothetical protein
MAGNKVTLTFVGDADSLTKSSKKADESLVTVGKSADKANKQLADAGESGKDLGTKLGHLGSAVSGASDAFDAIGGSLDAVNQLEQAGAERAGKLARAFNDVEQAQEDLQQAFRDGAQATIDLDQAAVDLQQANLDAATATRDYATAVKEHGKNSAEAQQAAIDLKQANLDAKQANEDSAQATRDASQATIDAKSAQLDLNDAQREAHPPELQKWSDELQMITPILSAAVGVVGLLTSAQWLWNASLWASPVTWIVLAIAALVAIIVIIATKTTWFQDLWKWAWTGIKEAAGAAWDWIKSSASAFWAYIQRVWDYFLSIPGKIKSAFASVADAVFAPFRWAFNKVSDAWNGTIGRLHWSVPGWVPGIGGNSISAPSLPHFHQGGIVPGGLGAETLAVLQAGERVTASSGVAGHAEEVVLLESSGSDSDEWILASLRRALGLRGGDPIRVLKSSRG